MKRLLSYLFIILLFLLSGIIQLKYALILNLKRTEEAELLYIKSRGATEEKLLYLVQSDLFEPTNQKKLELIDLYLKKGDLDKAEKVLKRIKSEEGYLKYAEFALERNDMEIANKYIPNISDKEKRKELELFSAFIGGNFEVITELDENPKTNTGKLLKAFNTKDYSNISGSGLSEKINALGLVGVNKPSAQLMVAEEMVKSGQLQIALFLLEDLKKEHSSVELHILESDIYVLKGDKKKALDSFTQAIETNPENQMLYEKGIALAREVGDTGKLTLFQQRISQLKMIQR